MSSFVERIYAAVFVGSFKVLMERYQFKVSKLFVVRVLIY